MEVLMVVFSWREKGVRGGFDRVNVRGVIKNVGWAGLLVGLGMFMDQGCMGLGWFGLYEI